MRQERITRRPRRRKPAPEQPTPVLVTAARDIAHVDDFVAHIDTVLEAT